MSGATPDTDQEETVQMATTARRIGRIAAASAVSAGLLLAGAGPALADDPGTSATPVSYTHLRAHET